MKKVITIILFINSIFSFGQNIESKDSILEKSPKIKILVLQCSNGYGLDDFRNVIEEELSKNYQFEIIPFPNKKLLGVTFQGVYDKKHCKPITEKIHQEVLSLPISSVLTDEEITHIVATLNSY